MKAYLFFGWLFISLGVGIIGHSIAGLEGIIWSMPIGVVLNFLSDYKFGIGLFEKKIDKDGCLG